jgi:hypothetical protein
MRRVEITHESGGSERAVDANVADRPGEITPPFTRSALSGAGAIAA